MTTSWIDGDTTGAGLATAAVYGIAFGAAFERACLAARVPRRLWR